MCQVRLEFKVLLNVQLLIHLLNIQKILKCVCVWGGPSGSLKKQPHQMVWHV